MQIHLAACDTSDLASSASGEWLTLAPAFLVAGAHTVATTLYPLIDALVDPADDQVLAALRQGADLAEAIRTTQRQGLKAWRAPAGRRDVANTPLIWAAYAVCTTGRQTTAKPPRTDPRPRSGLSGRCISTLAEAYDISRSIHDSVVTTAHFVAAYLTNEVDYYEDTSLARAVASVTGFSVAAKLLRARGVACGSASRPSFELIEALKIAVRIADNEGISTQPEHVLRACTIAGARGATLLRLAGADRRPQITGAIARNLAHARVERQPSFRIPPKTDTQGGEFIANVLALTDTENRADPKS